MGQIIGDLVNLAIGLRKLFIMLILYGLGIYMKMTGQLTGDQFVNLFKSTTIAYFGANGIEHVTTAVRHVFGNPSNLKQ